MWWWMAAVGLGGGVAFIAFAWVIELITGRREREMRLSLDERLALDRFDALYRVFAARGLPKLGRCELLRHITWIWKSTRFVALRSGRWSAAVGLFCFAHLCALLAFKTLVYADSHDLRLLFGARDLISYLALDG